MKKVRIAKKNPKNILRTLEIDSHYKPINTSMQTTSLLSSRQQLQTNRSQKRKGTQIKPLITSHRYKKSSSPNDGRENNLSLRKHRILLPAERQNIRHSLQSQSNDPFRERSPYLHSGRYNNTSSKRIIMNSSHKKQGLQTSLSRQKRYLSKLKSLKKRTNSQQIPKSLEQNNILKQAKKLMQQGESNKSILILKKYMKLEPNNLQALYILCVNYYNLGEYKKLIEIGQNLVYQDTDYPYFFIILARSYYKIGDKQSCIQKLKKYEQKFPNNEIVYLEIARFYQLQKNIKQMKSYIQSALQIKPNNIQALQKLYKYSQSVQEFSNIERIICNVLYQGKKLQIDKKQKLQDLLCNIYLKQKRYKQIFTKIKNIRNHDLAYKVGYAYYKTGQNQKASLIIQPIITQSEQPIKFIMLILAIKVSDRNFYDAMHLIDRIKHINLLNKTIINQISFIDGVLNLIRREITEGIRELENILQYIQTNKDSNQVIFQASQIIHGFLAYGYYCLGKHQLCQKHYQIQFQKYPQTKIQFLQYNRTMNNAIWLCNNSKQQEAVTLFLKASQMNSTRLQPYICLAITYFRIGYLKSQPQMFDLAKTNFQAGMRHITKLHNNAASHVFFFKCIYHAYLQEWRDAVICIDQAIQRAQQNYWKHFYVRALIFASLHNFSEAINDATIAINLRKNKSQLYFLRASCFQIEGDGTNAFQDLQFYIALRPDDSKIHTFAGKLLFENGAFEDALKAFDHEKVLQTAQNFDIFLTKAKTYFLLGKFVEAASQINLLHKICPEKQYLQFDANLMQILSMLIDQGIDRPFVIKQLESQYDERYITSQRNYIFKETELHSFKAICYFQIDQITLAIKQFQQAIKAKHKIVVRETLIEGNNREDQRDTRIYIAQMRFNIVLCYLKLGDQNKAIQNINKIQISEKDGFYQNYVAFRKTILSQAKINVLQKQQQIERLQVFPTRNKISNYLPDFMFTLSDKCYYSKLCIPFPKVEPPEIFPPFDQNIYQQLSADKVDKKPEAPWIFREQNSINFTGKIQRYSRLELDDDQDSTPNTSQVQFYPDSSHISIQSLSSRKVKISVNKATQLRNKMLQKI